MKSYIAIYRPLNILFIGVAQFLCAYFLDTSSSLESLVSAGVHWVILGTACAASFGYWVNDFLDQERDQINKKRPSAIQALSEWMVWLHIAVFGIASIAIGFMLGSWFLGVYSVTLLLLLLYSLWLKNVMLFGNIVIAVLCFLSLYMVYKLIPSLDIILVLHFAAVAGFLTLIRELLKDAEDIEGDRETGAKTLPIVLGLKVTHSAVFIVACATLLFTITSLYAQQSYLTTTMSYVYYTYYAVFIIFPIYKIAIDVPYVTEKAGYSKLAQWVKYVIFVGILSMMFF